jgi:8-oxo-dGTP pyrophosphatase MutT (NUDIX family)
VSAKRDIAEVDRLDCRLVAHDWAFAEARRDEIDRHWAESLARNPALFDGPVLLARRAQITRQDDARVLRLEAFETRFSRFLGWRDFGWPDTSVFNCFAMPAVRSSDGAYLLGEMGPSHSAAGQRYFPAGTPDLADVVGGDRVDLQGSLSRELHEETGLSANLGVAAPVWTIVFDGQRIACIKRIDWPEPAKALRARVRVYLAQIAEPELSDVHLLPPRAYEDPRLPAFMAAYLAHVSGGG